MHNQKEEFLRELLAQSSSVAIIDGRYDGKDESIVVKKTKLYFTDAIGSYYDEYDFSITDGYITVVSSQSKESHRFSFEPLVDGTGFYYGKIKYTRKE